MSQGCDPSQGPDLSVEIGKVRLKNPVLTASGTLGYGMELAPFMDLSRLGGFTTKSMTLEPRAGNPPERIVETPGGMLNAIGLANVGLERFMAEKVPELDKLGTALGRLDSAACAAVGSGIPRRQSLPQVGTSWATLLDTCPLPRGTQSKTNADSEARDRACWGGSSVPEQESEAGARIEWIATSACWPDERSMYLPFIVGFHDRQGLFTTHGPPLDGEGSNLAD